MPTASGIISRWISTVPWSIIYFFEDWLDIKGPSLVLDSRVWCCRCLNKGHRWLNGARGHDDSLIILILQHVSSSCHTIFAAPQIGLRRHGTRLREATTLIKRALMWGHTSLIRWVDRVRNRVALVVALDLIHQRELIQLTSITVVYECFIDWGLKLLQIIGVCDWECTTNSEDLNPALMHNSLFIFYPHKI